MVERDEGVEAFPESVLLGVNGEGVEPVDVVGRVGGDVRGGQGLAFFIFGR